jgi:chloramphenicol-sensitive protein RarD
VRRGVLFGLIAYGIWGLFPLYWPLLKPSSAWEILAHRIAWCALLMVLLLAVQRRWGRLRALKARTWGFVTAAAALIAVNWGVYIYAVNNGQVVDAALGYFINPLLSVGLGVVLLRERLRPAQWVAIAVAGVGVTIQTVEAGGFPVIALTLAVSFGLYGLAKKLVAASPTESLTGESVVLAPAALAFIIVLAVSEKSTFGSAGPVHAWLLAGTGLITIIPLLAFAAAAQRLPLSVMGLLQYVTPTLQFLLGVFWAHEPMPASRWLGFVVIWAALAIYMADGLRRARARSVADRQGAAAVADRKGAPADGADRLGVAAPGAGGAGAPADGADRQGDPSGTADVPTRGSRT